MQVKMTTSMAGPHGVWDPGDTVDFPEREASRLIDAGYAEPVAAKKATRRKKETADLAAPETTEAG